MKQLLLQAFNLIRQNPFYATISIIGTAVTIAFVMVVVMIYDFRTMDMAPESDRSDMMYTGSGMTYRSRIIPTRTAVWDARLLKHCFQSSLV